MDDSDRTTTQEKRQSLSLKSLYLDPNNYRFRDAEAYTPVDGEFTASDVQRRTNALILGKNNELVKDLIDSFKKNGFLPVDQIQVRKISDNKFLVIEGNRRVACLKLLQTQYDEKGYDLGALDPDIFSKLPVIYYKNADATHHLILMGLKHISGNKKWPAINQAELVRTLYFTHGVKGDDVCRSIGISRQEFNATLSTMALIDLYRESDYGDQFRSEQYSLFREVVRKPTLRTWLGWSDTERKVGHSENLKRLFSWLSADDMDEEDEPEDHVIGQGQKREAVLVKVSHIRELATIIEDENALSNLDTTRNLSEATLSSEALGKNKVQNAISLIGQEINQIFNNVHLVTDSDRSSIEVLSKKMSGVLEAGRFQEVSASSRNTYLMQPDHAVFFEKVTIERFRRLNKLSLDRFSQINLFAGINNSGKTTILEAIKILCSLNSPKDLIDLVRRRAKTPSEKVDMNWFVEQIPEIELSGVFSGNNISLRLKSESAEVDDETFYLQSAVFDVCYGEEWSSQTHFFEKYPPRTEGKIVSLCPSVFSSPFSGFDPELLATCHSASLKEGSKQTIIDFIKKNFDYGVVNIELDKYGRFTVVHDIISPNPDLTKFGEGLQRVFNLGLLFAAAKGGVVIIDELENAIHASILPELVRMIHQLAIQFNVQVFLSSHSKECIDAFINNKQMVGDLSTFALVEKDGVIEAVHFSGEKMARLVELIDFDIRGGKID
ncbi:MAG: AAA family ATPase [Nitrospirae bacterium]|nr:AAA family ATPase [Magnetococcales bacterium]HAT51214.1 hypothetical protein [Alphaproteobacteria bacterium]